MEASPNGRYVLYIEGDNYWTVDVASKAIVNITKNVRTSFVDKESDYTIKQKPAFGAVWLREMTPPLERAQVLGPEWHRKLDVDGDTHLGLDEPHATALQALCNLCHQLPGQK